MVIVTSLSCNHENADNQLAAIESWNKITSDVYSLNSKKEADVLREMYPENIIFITTHHTVEHIVGRPLVSINAVLDFARGVGEDLLLLNSDIILKELPELKDDGLTIFSRYDYIDNFDDAKKFENGFDVFYIPKKFLNIFPSSIDALGNPWWDYSLPLTAIRKGVPLYYPTGRFAFHKLHNTQYSIEEWTYLAEYFNWQFKIKPMTTPDAGKIATNTLAQIKINLNRNLPKANKGDIDIFYKTYHKDFKLLYYSLQSLKKNVIGYNKIIVLVPDEEKSLFRGNDLPDRTEIHYVKEYGNKYLFQQVCKMNAHKYCDAEFILFSDSDCIFTYPIDLRDFVKDGKPEILFTDYAQIEDAQIWKDPTESVMGEEVKFEYMRRNCLVYHRTTLENINKWQPKLEVIMMGAELFSEFNFLGAWAYRYERDKYNFINTDEWQYKPPKAEQLWSHFDKEGSEVHVEEYDRALSTINKALDLNLTEL